MRVVGGRLRGRALAAPKSSVIRPTADRLRESLFNILVHAYGDPITGARVLDLFAGTGALGIEALSRGARAVVFVESSPRAARAIRDNVRASDYGRRARVVEADVPRAVRVLARRGLYIDGVIADPPYGKGLVQRTVDAVVDAGVLAPSAWIAVEHRGDEAPSAPANFAVVASRRHGETSLTLLRRVPGQDAPATEAP
jgi:16S rRNA (guanine966-N2)-methyltransferase